MEGVIEPRAYSSFLTNFNMPKKPTKPEGTSGKIFKLSSTVTVFVAEEEGDISNALPEGEEEASGGRPSRLPSRGGRLKPRPPIFFPGEPDQGLPPMIGIPEQPIAGEEDEVSNELPAEVERPATPEHPIRGGQRPKPGHPIEKPPIHLPAKPEQGLPPMTGWELPIEECAPDPSAKEKLVAAAGAAKEDPEAAKEAAKAKVSGAQVPTQHPSPGQPIRGR
jgi:hypothetical protein